MLGECPFTRIRVIFNIEAAQKYQINMSKILYYLFSTSESA